MASKRSFDQVSFCMKRKILFCLSNSLLLILFTFYWIRLPFSFDDEPLLIQMTSSIRKIVFKESQKPAKKNYLFVNVSWDKKLIEKLDDYQIPVGNQAITDRKKLAQFLEIINHKPLNHKYLLMDVSFSDPSEDDSLLQQQFNKTQNYIVSYHKDDSGEPEYPIFNVKRGLSDYLMGQGDYSIISGDDKYLKCHLIQCDTLKTTPLIMYEKIHHKKYRKGYFLFDFIDKDLVSPSFIIDFRIRNYDLTESSDPYAKLNLGDILALPAEEIESLVKDRIVIIGDFEDRDIHDTIFGNMPGSLILLNTFIALENEDPVISFPFLLFLLLAFCLISWTCVSNGNLLEDFANSRNNRGFVYHTIRIFKGFLGYFSYFLLLYVFCYFLFDKHLTVLILSLYMEIINRLFIYFRKKHKLRQTVS
jgi:hypothetical protein